ncbi:MAG: divalent-cation tolerance protein CutA [Bacteroidales bacterium]
MSDDARLIYITAPNRDEALKLAQVLVQERLAACANVLGPITSVYWWDGKLNQDGEEALLLKTRADLVDALTARVRELHSYDCPCVVALPITGGNPAFLEWIASETRAQA